MSTSRVVRLADDDHLFVVRSERRRIGGSTVPAVAQTDVDLGRRAPLFPDHASPRIGALILSLFERQLGWRRRQWANALRREEISQFLNPKLLVAVEPFVEPILSL